MVGVPETTGGASGELLQESVEDLYEHAPCGYLSTDLDGRIFKVNQTLLDWLGYRRDEVVGQRTFQQLLSVGGRIYHETHYRPLLRMQGAVREIAVELVRRDGTRLPALVNSTLRLDDAGEPVLIRTTVFDATSRRGYERELLAARHAAERSESRLALLQQLVADLAAAPTSVELAHSLVRAARQAVKAVGSVVWVLSEDDSELVWSSGVSPADHPRLRRTPVASDLPQAECLRRNEVVLIGSLAAAQERYPPLIGELMATAGRRSLIFVPLSVGRGAAGVMAFGFDDTHAMDDDDLILVRTLGRQAGQALQRARLFDAEQRLRRRAEVLQSITAALAAALDARQVARGAVRRLVESLDFDRVLFLLDVGGRPAVAASAGFPPEVAGDGDAGVAADLRAALSWPVDSPRFAGPGDGAADTFPALAGAEPPGGLVVLPLRIGPARLGSLVLARLQARPFAAEERDFLLTFAAQCAQALERARLHEEAVEGKRRADFLAALSRRLDEPPGLQERADLLVDSLAPALAGRAAVWWLDDNQIVEVAVAPPGHATADESGGFPPPVATTLATGTAATDPVDGAVREVALPLRARGRVAGVLVLTFDPPLPLPDGLRFLTEVAELAGLALENGRLYDQERRNAHTLQRGLLAGEPPRDNRINIVTHYRPAGEDLEVGGDWYDSFLLGPDRVAIVVGDVVGRGIAAASAMGQVRSAIRALAPGEAGPARLLERLDRFVDRFEAGRMATVAYGELDLSTGRLRYACAGHLPPLLIGPDGEHAFLWGGRSAPLAAFAGSSTRDESTVDLPPGSRLLLYTDGLVERRDRRLDEEMNRLAAAAAARHRAPLASLLPALVELLAADGHHDDVCLLSVAFGAEAQFHRAVHADVGQLAPLRADFRSWLASTALAPDDQEALLLACSEATANAIEHGYRNDQRGLVQVRSRVVGGLAELTVRDDGEWRPPDAESDRGRGLILIDQLMDEVSLEHDRGTVIIMRRRIDRKVTQ